MAEERMEKSEEPKKRNLWPQFVAGFGVTLLLNQIGLSAGWSSPYVAKLTARDSPLVITFDEASWVVSLLNLGRLLGAIVGAVCVNYLGCKTSILITSLPMALTWIFTMVANRVEWLYIARLCGGIGMGMSYSNFPIYLGEVAHPKIRGMLMFLGMCGMSAGNLLMSIMGAFLDMEISSAICLAICLVLTGLFLWLPESPYHLIAIGNCEKARKSIAFYDRACDSQAELENLKNFVDSSQKLPFFKTLAEFRHPHVRRPMIVCLFLYMYCQMCGLNNILFYMESILISAKVTWMRPSVIVMCVMACGIVASALSIFLIDRYGRKLLLASSCALVAVSLVSLGAQFALIDWALDTTETQALALIAVFFFQIATFTGILPVPSTVLGELFAPNVKCVAACIGSVCVGIFSFTSAATYLPLVSLIGEKYTFWFYALLQLSAIPFIIFVMPETKGKSLQQIQSELMKL
ncbi:facilitated trehalose transporter Tret1-like [Prorops nasuta]|uniref:facilitated trehalose transporter Tret1-like n=1 Tax=Prorops nasuta TaxID=863751 RepID=UPI0034CF85E4